ncbi:MULTISPECIES: NADH-quinone oxidoreductase subunit NuoH [Rhodopseudomonas]|uniref:NADH-quinone oxidoreductase subunit H n=1 Tax=Rhodopseudomonas palustris TaxID=1076 RepID=A0A0D7F6Y9_RHOPL|nr:MULTISPECIES: NADH-quinone oxidoreductase subunit NuoH [Rhodopseudomonas]KIZ47482.1 NADH:ubiquinone oxidoreductase [Rhodopseudomonas palustris]MDF3813864.1 NADH-quinone oxidoreductase subunit NuoH [Rhodopseudomonas sp. BAL398]WOK15455.1 NADH-quinone oxidoreductase subunit NuoH [Rhodopseudomonas sp. BAL398]
MTGMLITATISVTMIMVLLVVAGTFTWVERRLLAFVQERLGPNRVGPFGFLQWVADTVKILTKEDQPPPGADRAAYILAPAVAATPILAGFGVVAFGDGLTLAAVDVGVLFLLGMMGLTVYAVVLGAWASHSRFALMGGLRAAAQMLAYEAFLGLSLMGVVMLAGSLSLTAIVEAQRDVWFVVLQPLGAALFCIGGVAAAHRLPFDLPESENDLVAGYITEYSGMAFGLFFLGEYLAVLLVSAFAVTLFFGGWYGPWLPGAVWFGLKTAVIAVVFVWIRATLPRPRYDQLLSFAWKIALPLALLNLLVTGVIVVARSAS